MTRPRRPKGLTEAQARAWRELLAEIERSRPASGADQFLLEAAAVVLARAREARDVANRGPIAPVGRDGIGANPALSVERQSWLVFERLARRLGIAPQLDPPGQGRLFK